MTKKRLFVEIAKSEVLSIFEIHIAMALTMRKDYAEMSAMYGYTLATTLSRLKKKNVVFQNKRGNWELNTNTEEWHDLEAPPKKETNNAHPRSGAARTFWNISWSNS